MLIPAYRQSAAAQVARAAIGGGLGLAGGAVITLSVIVARARFQGEYLESIDDLGHWQTVPLIVAPAVGVMFGLAGRDRLVASIIGSSAGMVIGATAGGMAGWLSSDMPEWPWAGAVMGAGAGLAVGGLLLGIRKWIVAALLICACGPQSPAVLPLPDPVAEPDPRDVESVVFLYGDAGAVRDDNSPLLSRLKYDIERWSASLEADSSVIVIALGDVVYPDGVRTPDTKEYAADTAIAMSQVRLVTGPYTRDHGTRAFFLAGNHDWAGLRGWEGVARLRNLGYALERARTQDSAAVRLVPAAGTGGPFVIDVGKNLRLVMLDTAWWLLESSASTKAAVLRGVEDAIAAAGEREVVIATHHPFKSGGPHGGNFPFWQTAGARYLLSKSGAILQDVTSVPYRELEYGLRDIFERHGGPLVFAGGHEHSLQVIEGVEATDPSTNLVSGAGSKLTAVGSEPGLRFARSSPGYMQLIFEKDGGVTLFVESAERAYLKCPDAEPTRAQCMANGFAAFDTEYSQRLR